MILDDIAINTNLNENERQLLQYISEHLEEVPSLSSRELARRNFMSSTAVLRCIKKLGFQNYNDFKLNVNGWLRSYSMEEIHVAENDELLDLMNKMTMLNQTVISQTKEGISLDILKKVIEKLDQCMFIDVIANDENSEIASYASYNFAKAGKMMTVYRNAGLQMFAGINLPSDHVVIVISKYGENVNILRTMQLLKKRRITVISIISRENKRMEELSTYSLSCYFDNSLNSFTDLIFNMSVKYILDLLYAGIFARHYHSTIEAESLMLKLFRR